MKIFLRIIKMTEEQNKLTQLVLQSDEASKEVDESVNQTGQSYVKSGEAESEKVGYLKPPPSPLTKKWFRKQFGIRRDKTQLDDRAKPLTISSFQKGRRRSSSLPDLASMLEAAASLKRHHSFNTRSSCPLKMPTARNESVLWK